MKKIWILALYETYIHNITRLLTNCISTNDLVTVIIEYVKATPVQRLCSLLSQKIRLSNRNDDTEYIEISMSPSSDEIPKVPRIVKVWQSVSGGTQIYKQDIKPDKFIRMLQNRFWLEVPYANPRLDKLWIWFGIKFNISA